MTTTRQTPIRTTEELFAHAIEIEREAAARYAELGERMRDLGNDVVAELFLRLADAEARHEKELRAKASGLFLPHLEPGQYAWLEEHGPETAAHDLVLNLLTPHGALQVALDAEKRALAFFESVRKTAANVQLSMLAGEMAAEEGVHIEWVKSALRRTPDPVVDWAAVFS
jgi:rubrerythrin